MDSLWRQTFFDWSRTPEHAGAVSRAVHMIAEALSDADQPYVAFSGGKDSTCLLHLVLHQRPDTAVLIWDYGRAFVPGPIWEEIQANARRIGATRLRVETSPLYERLGRTARNVLGREYIAKVMPQLADEGYDLAFVGLRAEESLKRKRRIRRRQFLSARIRECWPLRDWRWLDVWAYIVAHELPYLSLYDEEAPIVGWDRVRFTTLFDPEFYHLGTEAVHNVLHWHWRNDG